MEPKKVPGFYSRGSLHRAVVDLNTEDAEAVARLAREEAERTGSPLNMVGTLRTLVHGALRERAA